MLEKIVTAVGEAYRNNQDHGTNRGISVIRIRSGMNNALYRVGTDDGVFACKLCVADERRRAQREFATLQLLDDLNVDVGPRPLGLDESETLAPYPAVVYVWLDGVALDHSLSADQLEALRDALQQLHAIEPASNSTLPEAWFHWFDRELYLAELFGFLENYRGWLQTKVPNGAAMARRLSRLVEACSGSVRSRNVNISRAAVHMRLCHVDPNPANLIWSADKRLRWVDWEYSGWGDPALDLAEYRWHERWDSLSASQHAWLREQYNPPPGDDNFWDRVALWDCLLSCRWPFLTLRWLWSIYNGPERLRLTMQDVRAGELRLRLERLIQRAEQMNGC
jgi:aminoglycoside phosphotransferase (APT) family kinase protein